MWESRYVEIHACNGSCLHAPHCFPGRLKFLRIFVVWDPRQRRWLERTGPVWFLLVFLEGFSHVFFCSLLFLFLRPLLEFLSFTPVYSYVRPRKCLKKSPNERFCVLDDPGRAQNRSLSLTIQPFHLVSVLHAYCLIAGAYYSTERLGQEEVLDRRPRWFFE